MVIEKVLFRHSFSEYEKSIIIVPLEPMAKNTKQVGTYFNIPKRPLYLK